MASRYGASLSAHSDTHEALAQVARIRQAVATNKLSHDDLLKQLAKLSATLQIASGPAPVSASTKYVQARGSVGRVASSPTLRRRGATVAVAQSVKPFNYSLPRAAQPSIPASHASVEIGGDVDGSDEEEDEDDDAQDDSFRRLSDMLERSIVSGQDALSTPGGTSRLLQEDSIEERPLFNAPVSPLGAIIPQIEQRQLSRASSQNSVASVVEAASQPTEDSPTRSISAAPPSYDELISSALTLDDGVAGLNNLIDSIALATRQLQPSETGFSPVLLILAFAVLFVAVYVARSGHLNCHCICPATRV